MIPDVDVLRPRVGAAVVELRGEHDLATRSEIHDLFTSLVEENDLVVVDVTEAHFVDSTFLLNLAKAHRLAESRGSRLCLQLGTAPIVHRALEVSGLLEHLECVTDRERAMA